ncbi:MAG: PorP/SprF family type IX secretion system membrane protein [Bacteroidota bacterium]
MKARFLGLILVLFSMEFVKAQDIHFSQFYSAPLLQNPANAGFFNCDYRLVANYRNQWRSVTVPYTTFHASGDIRKIKGKNKNIIGLGLDASVDKAGDSKFTTTQFGFAGSVHKAIDKFAHHYFGGGLMLGIASANIDYTHLQFSDMYITTNSFQLTSENTSLSTLTYFDLSAGAAYNFIPPSFQNSFAMGLAVYHINKPRKTFTNDDSSRVFRKLVFNMSANLHASSRFEFYPKFQYSMQGYNHELMLGGFVRVDLDKMKNSRYGLYLGPWYRWNDALVIVTRFDVDKMSFAFNYDLNVSPLSEASDTKGGPELSIIYIGCIPHFNKKIVYCPRF